MSTIRRIAKRVLPARLANVYRRRRAFHRFLRQLSHEVYGRHVRMDLPELEGRMAARRDGFYQQVVREVLDRTDLILQELDRRIEGINARSGSELRRLADEVATLRAQVERLQRDLHPTEAEGVPHHAAPAAID